MKKVLALILALLMVVCVFAACGKDEESDNDGADINAKSEGVMTYAEYMAAEIGTSVTVEAYVQATQSWWNDTITIYAQDGDGGYFFYNTACSEADAKKLTPGTKVRVTGDKAEWAGEIEISGGTIEILADATYVAPVTDVTAQLGTDALVNSQNKKVAFKGLTIEASTDADGNEVAFLYNWDGSGSADGDSDLYFKASVGGNTYTFVIEYYLCGPDTDAYKAVSALNVGDTVDLEGFLYWYNGMQPHITAVTKK